MRNNLAGASAVYQYCAVFFALIIVLCGCEMKADEKKGVDSQLPRFAKLEIFNPHRSSFECKYEADVTPHISPEAEIVFQQALALDNYDLWPEQRNYPKVVSLYEEAMKLGHWKAQFNLASLYLTGTGVPQDAEKAIELTEDLMRKGVPAAWDRMGTFYIQGTGSLKQDATVAYAFWQRAADMGSKDAQAYIGKKLLGNHDEPPSFWGNRVIGLKMLECGYAQNSAQAAGELGLTLYAIDGNYSRALDILQQGVRLGSVDSANLLVAAFDDGERLVNNRKDQARAQRYSILSDALNSNPNLRLPNLDKILPLPPADLPLWDGDKQTLINAAKAVVKQPVAPPVPASNPAALRTGRAFIPEDRVLPERPAVQAASQYETTKAPESGYWIARLMFPRTDRHFAWNAEQVPMRYEAGELFDRTRPGLVDEDGRIMFHYLGQPIPVPPVALLPDHPLVARGVARYASFPVPPLRRRGHLPCPETGIWAAKLSKEHPLAAVFNDWTQQAYLTKGASFPAPKARHLDIEPNEVVWTWRGNANIMRSDGVSLIALNSADGTGGQA